jgi:hypothetical protein
MFGRRKPESWFSWQSLLLGLAIGALLALALTPYSGKRLRSKLIEGVERARSEVRGTEQYGGGEHADPLAVVKRRWNEAMAEARKAYAEKRRELLAELERDRQARSGRSA